MLQRTLKYSYNFEGKGLHTGCFSHICIKPAPVDTGIVFVRTDLSEEIPALASNVSSTARSTRLSCGKASVGTVEHVLSALTGLGVDNALIETDAPEMPILDGSARMYVEAIAPDGLLEQDAERVYVPVSKELCFQNLNGGYIKVIPSDEFSVEVTIDFNSRVLGVQTVSWTLGDDYATQVAPCRTFCFFHEIVRLAAVGLAKGGSVDNAIIVVEKPTTDRQLATMSKLFHQPKLSVSEKGYLSNVNLRFDDECGRHKLLDIIGDIRLCGGFPKAKIIAFKPGHRANTSVANMIQKQS